MRALVLEISFGLLFLGVLPAQGSAPLPTRPAAPLPRPLPAQPLVARIDGAELSLSRYQEWLVQISGRAPLEELLYQELLRRATEQLGVSPSALELRAEQERAWKAELVQRLERSSGDQAAVERELQAQGHDLDSWRRRFEALHESEFLEQRVVLATRNVQEAAVYQRFEQRYGPDGLKLELSHILLTRSLLRAELQRSGSAASALTNAELDRRLIEQATSLLGELQAGASFEELARLRSHDNASKNQGGRLDAQALGRFGPQLEAAVWAAPTGLVQGPVQSDVGVHLFLVQARVRTEFTSVREALRSELGTLPASFQERQATRARLFAAAHIERL